MGNSSHSMPERHNDPDHDRMVDEFRRRFFFSLMLTLPVLALSPFIQRLFGFRIAFSGDAYVLFALSAAIYFYGGWPFLKGVAEELRNKSPGMMTLVSLAISVAFFYSAAVTFGLQGEVFFWELATLIDVMLLGHWVEMRSVTGASRALESLAKLMPSEAHLVTGKKVEDVPVSQLSPGSVVLVKPGEKVPADGVVIEGESTVNEAMLTGESMPATKKKGSSVVGASVNGEGAIYVKVTQAGEKSYLSQVMALVRQAQQSKSRTQDVANKAASLLTLIAISVGLITFFSWVYSGRGAAFAIERMVTVMVIACPHALGLAVPLVVAVSTSLAVRNGILVRNRAAFERARKVSAVVFDKTGTLTEGNFEVTSIVPFGRNTEERVLSYAASVESGSEHPIAQGIVHAAKNKKIRVYKTEKFKSIRGIGVQGIVNRRLISVLSHKALGNAAAGKRAEYLIKQGKTVVYVSSGKAVLGAIALGDIIRQESKEAVNQLKKAGLRCVMITGDNSNVAESVSKEIGLDAYFAEVLPHEKAEAIKKMQAQGQKVAMVGDGVNDAPALMQADVGIAIGAGTDVAIESADIVLVGNDPRAVVKVLGLAEATYKKMVQNLLWAAGYNLFAIPLAAGALYTFGIFLTPAVGAALMSLSTVIVAVNARLLSANKKRLGR